MRALIHFGFTMFCICCALQVQAQDLRALARVDIAASELLDEGDETHLRLALSRGVPFKITTFIDPMRIVVDFKVVEFDASIASLDRSQKVTRVEAGVIEGGWSRLVLELSEPMSVSAAWMDTDDTAGTAIAFVTLAPTDAETFAQTAKRIDVAERAPALPLDRLVKVALDPGHGGVDPGAERSGEKEADLMLQFARELREALLRTGRYEVVLTRNNDEFVSLPQRVSIARDAGADVFLSLHADALAKGNASGLTVYTLSDDATDKASSALAERQNRADIVAGVDLQGDDDQIATVLMDLARQNTAPKASRLADILVSTIGDELGNLHKRPRLEAGFSVLKAPDIPSVLIELGFMSSPDDLAALIDPEWREKAAIGIGHALDAWVLEARTQADQ